MQTQILLSTRLLLRILFHPGFPALASCSIAPRERKSANFRVGNCYLLARILGVKPDERLSERSASPPVKQISFDFIPILAGDGHIPPVIKRLFQGSPQLLFAGKFGNPAFQALLLRPWGDFERI